MVRDQHVSPVILSHTELNKIIHCYHNLTLNTTSVKMQHFSTFISFHKVDNADQSKFSNEYDRTAASDAGRFLKRHCISWAEGNMIWHNINRLSSNSARQAPVTLYA